MFDPALIDMVLRLRSAGVSDSDVLRAVEQTPRKPFLPPALADRAYTEAQLPIACGQSATPPGTAALMLQVLGPQTDMRLLEIGTGTGWTAAVASRLSERVYSVERYRDLASRAEDRLRAQGFTKVGLRHGDGRHGWPSEAPFKRIVLWCAVRAVPERLLDQLAPGGRLVAVVDGTLTRICRARKHLSEEELMPMTLPMIEAGKSRAL